MRFNGNSWQVGDYYFGEYVWKVVEGVEELVYSASIGGHATEPSQFYPSLELAMAMAIAAKHTGDDLDRSLHTPAETAANAFLAMCEGFAARKTD